MEKRKKSKVKKENQKLFRRQLSARNIKLVELKQKLTIATSSILLMLRTNIFTLTYAGPSEKERKLE